MGSLLGQAGRPGPGSKHFLPTTKHAEPSGAPQQGPYFQLGCCIVILTARTRGLRLKLDPYLQAKYMRTVLFQMMCFNLTFLLILGRHARDVVLHISHDAWVEDEKQDIPMRQLSDKEVGASFLSHSWRQSTPLYEL